MTAGIVRGRGTERERERQRGRRELSGSQGKLASKSVEVCTFIHVSAVHVLRSHYVPAVFWLYVSTKSQWFAHPAFGLIFEHFPDDGLCGECRFSLLPHEVISSACKQMLVQHNCMVSLTKVRVFSSGPIPPVHGTSFTKPVRVISKEVSLLHQWIV